MDSPFDFGKMRRTGICRVLVPYDSPASSKKNEFKPHLKKCWCIPPKQNAAFVAAMEDVLAVYSRAYDERFPVVCMNEKPVQFFEEARKSFRSKRTGICYEDNAYIRNGTCSILLFTEPLRGGGIPTLRKQGENRIGQNRLIGC